jgi:hypothetical protein
MKDLLGVEKDMEVVVAKDPKIDIIAMNTFIGRVGMVILGDERIEAEVEVEAEVTNAPGGKIAGADLAAKVLLQVDVQGKEGRKGRSTKDPRMKEDGGIVTKIDIGIRNVTRVRLKGIKHTNTLMSYLQSLY